MRIRDIIKIFALSAVVIFTSCDDFLDQESQSQISTSEMYSSIADCEYGLAAMYNALKAPNVYALTDELMRSDLATTSSRTNVSNNAYMQNFTNAYSASSNKWAALYQVVFRANQLLAGADLLGETLTAEAQVETLNFYRAQAHFVRGLAYMWLHNSYNGGSVPLVTKASTTPEDIYVPCSTHDEVRSFYRSDFRNAAFTYGDYMHDSWDEAPEWTGIATKQAAYAFLGQSYLYEAGYLENGHGTVTVTPSQGDAAGAYDMAANYFEMIIDDNKFSLVDSDVIGTMTSKGEFNDESIFEINYTTEYNSDYTSVNNYLYNTWNMNISITAYATAVPAMWLVDTYDAEAVDPLQDQNWFEQALDSDGDLVFKLGEQIYEIVTTSTTSVSTVTYCYQTEKDTTTGLPVVETRASDNNQYLVFSDTGLAVKTVTSTYDYDEELGESVWTTSSPTYVYTTLAGYTKEFVGPGNHDTENVRVYSSESSDPTQWEIKTLRKVTPRKAYTLVTPHCTELSYHLDNIWSVVPNFNNNSVGYFRWMSNWETVEDEDDTVPTQTSSINYRIMRLADVYLMYAECLAELNTTRGRGTALDYINRVRYRAGSTLLGTANEYDGVATYDNKSYSNSEIIEHIRWKERPMEFSIEGQSMRVCDLRRWGKQEERFKQLATYARYRASHYIIKESSTTGLLSATWATGPSITLDERDYVIAIGNDNGSTWGTTQVIDYTDAAKNFLWADNAYWPIPNNEVLANPYIDN